MHVDRNACTALVESVSTSCMSYCARCSVRALAHSVWPTCTRHGLASAHSEGLESDPPVHVNAACQAVALVNMPAEATAAPSSQAVMLASPALSKATALVNM